MAGFWILVSFGFIFVLGLTLLVISLFSDDSSTTSPSSVLNPTSVSEINDPDQLVHIAEKFEDNQQWDKAINTWSRYLQVHPEGKEAYIRRGQAAFRAKRYRQAIEDFTSLIDESDDTPEKAYLFLARTHKKMGNHEEALQAYRDYVSVAPDDLEGIREAATFALELENYDEAKKFNNRIIDADQPETNKPALLDLATISLREGNTDRAEYHLRELENYKEKDLLDDEEELEYLYRKAQLHEQKGNNEEANELYRSLYQKNTNFRDVQEKIEQQLTNMSRPKLKRKIAEMEQDDFLSFCRRIVEGMGFEVVREECLNPEEVEIRAIEDGFLLSETKILFGFKKWSESVGELPVKDFELKMVEERFQRGILVNLGGFNSTSKNYARGNNKLELVGPEKLLSNMKEWYVVETENDQS